MTAISPDGPDEVQKTTAEAWSEYQQWTEVALRGDKQAAKDALTTLLLGIGDNSLRARIHNDLGVIATIDGNLIEASKAFELAVEFAPGWSVPQENSRQLLQRASNSASVVKGVAPRTRVAILSLLFNWPSTGGGTVHTAETGKFLQDAGYEVRHFYAEFRDWGLGNVTEPPLVSSEALSFSREQWTPPEIQHRFRSALWSFQPDWVIITDSWNSKPILAEAAKGFRFLIRIAAQECLCPLNNVRLLFNQDGFTTCPKHQFATPDECCGCVLRRGKTSGGLHQAEREFVGYGTKEYDEFLRRSFASAEAVLVVNPLIAAMVSPYAKRVLVIPSGFDSSRFANSESTKREPGHPVRLLFAGLVDEPMKGFAVLREACRRLWLERQDFELWATADPPAQPDPFARYIGWQTQSRLPEVMQNTDILVFPTVAEEALGRTAVEAMGASRPVVASRIGGLQFTVVDGATGLLFDPGDVNDLCRKLRQLMDDRDYREQLGRAGRKRFDEHYRWESILEKHYKPLLGEPARRDD